MISLLRGRLKGRRALKQQSNGANVVRLTLVRKNYPPKNRRTEAISAAPVALIISALPSFSKLVFCSGKCGATPYLGKYDL